MIFSGVANRPAGKVRVKPVHEKRWQPKELRPGNFQILADLTRSELDDFTMARHGGNFLGGAVDVDRVIAALAQKLATVAFQMPD